MSEVVPGFSLINRWLLYTSFLLAPAQFVSGINNNCPSNLGFLAYNIYNQILFFRAVKGKKLEALSMLIPHLNTTYSLSYLGGITSGNYYMGTLLGLGTAALLVLNNVTAWLSWATNQRQGYGVYQFFFFGWHTMNGGWHNFFLMWSVFDSILTIFAVVGTFVLAIGCVAFMEDEDGVPWWSRYAAIPAGAFLMMFFFWPTILWTELIMQRNEIISETDWVAVWLFTAQVVAMLLPSCGCFKGWRY